MPIAIAMNCGVGLQEWRGRSSLSTVRLLANRRIDDGAKPGGRIG
ncbi:hypothetical protein [Mycolicibacterium septicum]|nr:hypothetical protein [Mycolicibacterium septicum]